MGQFTIEFYRIREHDDAHAILEKVSLIGRDLDSARTKAISMFENANMPQNPDGFRILDQDGDELCRWVPDDKAS